MPTKGIKKRFLPCSYKIRHANVAFILICFKLIFERYKLQLEIKNLLLCLSNIPLLTVKVFSWHCPFKTVNKLYQLSRFFFSWHYPFKNFTHTHTRSTTKLTLQATLHYTIHASRIYIIYIYIMYKSTCTSLLRYKTYRKVCR